MKNLRIYWISMGALLGRFFTITSTDGGIQGGSDKPDFAFFGIRPDTMCRCSVEIMVERDDGTIAENTYVVFCDRETLRTPRVRVSTRFAWPGDVFVVRVAANHVGPGDHFVNMRREDEDGLAIQVANAGMHSMRGKYARDHGTEVPYDQTEDEVAALVEAALSLDDAPVISNVDI